MKHHVLPGDAQVEKFRKTNIEGEIVVCRECLIVGDVDADTLPEFFEQRARFIHSEYGEDEVAYRAKVAGELVRLINLPRGSEVNLWFEYELFCSANMWFCLWMLREKEATVYRIAPIVLALEDIWNGFSNLNAAEMKECFRNRIQLTTNDINLGSELWSAYRHGDQKRLRELSKSESTSFPYLKEVCEAAIDKNTRPRQIIAEIMTGGFTDIQEIVSEFSERAGIYGYGEAQVRKIIAGI